MPSSCKNLSKHFSVNIWEKTVISVTILKGQRRPQNLRSYSSLSSVSRLDERQLNHHWHHIFLKASWDRDSQLVSCLFLLTVSKFSLCKIKCFQLLFKPFATCSIHSEQIEHFPVFFYIFRLHCKSSYSIFLSKLNRPLLFSLPWDLLQQNILKCAFLSCWKLHATNFKTISAGCFCLV